MKVYSKQYSCHVKSGFFKEPFTSYIHYVKLNKDNSLDELKIYVNVDGKFRSSGWQKSDFVFDLDAMLMAGYEDKDAGDEPYENLRCARAHILN